MDLVGWGFVIVLAAWTLKGVAEGTAHRRATLSPASLGARAAGMIIVLVVVVVLLGGAR